MIQTDIRELIAYGVQTKLVPREDVIYTTNRLLELSGLDELEEVEGETYENESPQAATDYYYKLSCDSDYIRRYRICKDRKWVTPTKYGDLDRTTGSFR